MIYEEMPEDFRPTRESACCFIENAGKILLLRRQDHKIQGNTWGFVGGKLEDDETIYDAVKREAKEETGISLKDPKYLKKLFFRYPDRDFICHIFHEVLDDVGDIVLRDEEHKDFKWVKPKDALKMPLVLDGDSCVKLFYGIE